MKQNFSLLLAGIAFVGSTTPSSAHHQNFEICNASGDVMFVNIVHRVGFGVFSGTWTSEGHYRFEPGACSTTPMGDAKGHAYLSVIFVDSAGNITQSDYGTGRLLNYVEGVDERFCVDVGTAYKHEGSLESMSQCGAEAELQKFQLFVDLWDNQTKKTLELK